MANTKTNKTETSTAVEVKTAKTNGKVETKDVKVSNKSKKERLAELRKISKMVNPALKRVETINRNLEKLMEYSIIADELDDLKEYKKTFQRIENDLYSQIPELV